MHLTPSLEERRNVDIAQGGEVPRIPADHILIVLDRTVDETVGKCIHNRCDVHK
ncbi:MAG TPA: hypothetical protein VFZ48_05525 [Candidatus Saccharimonadales bacterium]